MKRDEEEDLVENDGKRPDEVVGPQDSEGSVVRSEFRATRDGGVEDSEFEANDEVHESFPVEPIPVVMAPDGLPAIITPSPQQTQAIAFTYDTVICLEDDRGYVEIWEDEMSPCSDREKQRISMGRSRYDDKGVERARKSYKPAAVERRWGLDVVNEGEWWRAVRPVRPQCAHYRRQVFSNDDQPDPSEPGHQIVFRVCAARRSNGGAHMSLRDEGIYVCDFRDPPDPKTKRFQDEKDRAKLRNRPDLTYLPLFDMPGDAIQLSPKEPPS